MKTVAQKRLARALLLGFIATLFVATGCQNQAVTTTGDLEATSTENGADGSEADADELIEPPKREYYSRVASFSGRGPATTSSFAIKSDEHWRVTVTQPQAGSGLAPFRAQLFLSGQDETGPNHGTVSGSGSDPVSLIFAETGSFVIKMEAVPSQGWNILVEEIVTKYPE